MNTFPDFTTVPSHAAPAGVSPSPGVSSEKNYLIKMTGAVWRKPKKERSVIVHKVPLNSARSWLKKQAAKGKIIDLKVYGGLFFAP